MAERIEVLRPAERAGSLTMDVYRCPAHGEEGGPPVFTCRGCRLATDANAAVRDACAAFAEARKDPRDEEKQAEADRLHDAKLKVVLKLDAWWKALDNPYRTVHELKTWPVFFDAVCAGVKPFELRRDDRGFKEGDRVVLREFDPGAPAGTGTGKGYTGRRVVATIAYVLRNAPPGFGLEPGYCILTLADMEASRQ